MPFCTCCGLELEPEANFCANCGTPPMETCYAPPNTTTPRDFVLIHGGTFTMGSNSEKGNTALQYVPCHEETVDSFFMGKYVVTQREYQEIMGHNPSRFKGGDLPVENIRWFDAIHYCNRRSEREGFVPVYAFDEDILAGILPIIELFKSGKCYDLNIRERFPAILDIPVVQNADGYRLPTSAEWEYACRAGTSTAFNTAGDTITDAMARFKSGNQPALTTAPVGTFSQNAWGLYDMHGNVKEFCQDHWGTHYKYAHREVRGGGWDSDSQKTSSFWRDTCEPGSPSGDTGFRVVRSALGKETAPMEAYRALLDNKRNEIKTAVETYKTAVFNEHVKPVQPDPEIRPNCPATDGAMSGACAEQTPRTAEQRAAEIERLKTLDVNALKNEFSVIAQENKIDIWSYTKKSAWFFVCELALGFIYFIVREQQPSFFEETDIYFYIKIICIIMSIPLGLSANKAFSIGRTYAPILAVCAIMVIVLCLACFIGVQTSILSFDAGLSLVWVSSTIFFAFSAYLTYAIRKKLIQHAVPMPVFRSILLRASINALSKVCKKCGTALEPHTVFCANCGAGAEPSFAQTADGVFSILALLKTLGYSQKVRVTAGAIAAASIIAGIVYRSVLMFFVEVLILSFSAFCVWFSMLIKAQKKPDEEATGVALTVMALFYMFISLNDLKEIIIGMSENNLFYILKLKGAIIPFFVVGVLGLALGSMLIFLPPD